MEDSQDILVLITLVYGIALYVATTIVGPRIGILGRNAYFDKSRVRQFLKFLLIVVIASLALGYAIARTMQSALQYAGLNALVSAALGASSFLFRDRSAGQNTREAQEGKSLRLRNGQRDK